MSNVSITILEDFPTELFLEVFRILNGYDIFKAFYGLNHRLSTLVLTYGIKYIDLSETSLDESQKMLSIVNCSQVHTLKLSGKYNDELIEQLLDNNHFPLEMFNSLYSLTFYSIGLFTCHSIVQQRFDLINLKSLIIQFRSGLCREKLFHMYRIILNNLCFNFKSLKLLNLSILNVDGTILTDNLRACNRLFSSTEISSSLQYLSIHSIQINDIETILSHFPNLCGLCAHVKLNIQLFDYPLLPNLTGCVLYISSSQLQSLVRLLKQCPNLEDLLLYIKPASTNDNALVSHQWENLIGNYLLKLRRFKLDMTIKFIPMNIIEDLFTNNFPQNKFWLDRKTKLEIIKEESTDGDGLPIAVIVEFAI